MTLDEAKADLNTIYKTLQRERAMREKVIKDPAKQAAGPRRRTAAPGYTSAEIDQALAALLRIRFPFDPLRSRGSKETRRVEAPPSRYGAGRPD